MKRMLICVSLLLALCACLPALAADNAAPPPAVGKFQGSYNITFFEDPTFQNLGTECVVFTNTGTILGFPNSGTLQVAGQDWEGTWYVNGDELDIDYMASHEFFLPLIGTRLAINRIGGRWTESDFDDTNVVGDTVFAGTFSGNFVPSGCPAVAKKSARNPLKH